MAEKVPVFGPLMRRSVACLSERGDQWVTQSADQFAALVGAVAARLVNVVLDEMDLNALVRERLDIDALAADLDIEAVINRVDLIALADRVIEGVDLPAIIRESTNLTLAVAVLYLTACWTVSGATAGAVTMGLRSGLFATGGRVTTGRGYFARR